ncbi:hypothetical protein BO83DRAFT_400541 [Aspergillus eucalypticola CBS 122712]|uniref:Uncharacterized protein n=1 Tax=Aspergillus eucalypticola (strain CBS 122712 / IBT 29274) TaxID=1448314 RepID=A0A317V454_ASPEC|nr:uncharacterized protein BO83DRAFT_400541 [Aspergillus eucalypticola CBS 122712]PWY68865.1 hypothetical protein BO83DRAFT_400541 [Aspergillus eucalypticola CBS 122712]
MDLAGKTIDTLNGPAEGSRCLLQAYGERRPPTASDLTVECLIMLDYSILHGRRAGWTRAQSDVRSWPTASAVDHAETARASTRHGSVESCTECPHDQTSGLFWDQSSYKLADGMKTNKAAPIHSFASFGLSADGSHPGHSSHLRLSTECIEQRVARQIRVRNPIPVCKFTLFLGCWSPRPSSYGPFSSIYRPEPDSRFVEYQWQCALARAKIRQTIRHSWKDDSEKTRPLVMMTCTLRCIMRLQLGPNITSVEV